MVKQSDFIGPAAERNPRACRHGGYRIFTLVRATAGRVGVIAVVCVAIFQRDTLTRHRQCLGLTFVLTLQYAKHALSVAISLCRAI